MMTEQKLREHLMGVGFSRQDFENNRVNYLIEAGAGAGKTTIMVQRIVNQLVTGYYKPEDIVAITFTRKSTLELQDRIQQELINRKEEALEKRMEAERVNDAAALKQAEEQVKLLNDLLRDCGRMQVSTIHSFCQTMLEAMPFSSPLGMDMQVTEDDELQAKTFLRLRMQKDPTLFRKAMDMGVPVFLLERFFLERRGNGEAEIQFCSDPAVITQWEKNMEQAAVEFHDVVHTHKTTNPMIKPFARKLIAMDHTAFSNDPTAKKKLAWQVLYDIDGCPFAAGVPIADRNKFLSGEGEAFSQAWMGSKGEALRKAAGPLLHSYIMEDMERLLKEYREDKLRVHRATYDDLLLRTRDMLRDNEEAWGYFHQRYKTLYVDEMQDTDPVQTEMLFYLTAEEHVDGSDWRSCKPVPGSLFLVGDPKQAIYRFRGADIGVYNELLKRFRNSADPAWGTDSDTIGEKITLRYNFRSAKEICDLVDVVFQPDPAVPAPHQFTGDGYHAAYVAMDAKNGARSRARVASYPALQDQRGQRPRNSAMQVAEFIKCMIDDCVTVGTDNDWKQAHPVRAGDFLILTPTKSSPRYYAEALKSLNIPVEISGEQEFIKTVPVKRAVTHLRALYNPWDDRALFNVLQECYPGRHTDVENLRRFQLRTGSKSLAGVLRSKTLASIRAALELEVPRDQLLLELCFVLEEQVRLRKLVHTLPAMAVIERLLEGGYGVWDEEELTDDPDARRQAYSEVQQYLNLVRKSKERSFPALAEYAIMCAEKTFEHELELEPTKDVVRVMNLHKAKGLEGEIVILVNGEQRDIQPTRYVDRCNGTMKEYVALHRVKGMKLVSEPLAWSETWKTIQRKEEQKYLSAEYARLLYVAATRAKTLLLVCSGVPDKAGNSYWAPLLKHVKQADEADPHYGQQFKALLTGSGAAAVQVRQQAAQLQVQSGCTQGGSKPSLRVDPVSLEEKLAATATKLAENGLYSITPSKLDRHGRGESRRKDEEDLNTTEDLAESIVIMDDDDESKSAAESPAVTKEMSAEEGTMPYGPVWGTIVHRVMELAVRSGAYTAVKLTEFARRAVAEELPEGEVPRKQRKMLRLTEEQRGEVVIAQLAEQAAAAVAFLKEENCDLRKLLTKGKAYPELPFFLQIRQDDPESEELYRHLSAHINSKNAVNRTLAVEGIIDLAVRTEDGWYVVDYKTDKQWQDEADDAFKQRLRAEYTPQIMAYARVLEKAKAGVKVHGAWLCAVARGGEMIQLDITSGQEKAAP